jgi:hypothetical protein
MSDASLARRISGLVLRVRMPMADEPRLRDLVERELRAAAIAYERESWLSGDDRIDFLCETGVGIECKSRGGRTGVLRQLSRYAASPDIASLVLVTTRLQHRGMPAALGGKPILVACCWSAP